MFKALKLSTWLYQDLDSSPVTYHHPLKSATAFFSPPLFFLSFSIFIFYGPHPLPLRALNTRFLGLFLLLFHDIMCMGILHACVHVYHLYAS